MNISRSEAIKRMLALKLKDRPDLSALYSAEMECQVLVGRDGGTREGDYQGWRGCTWTDGMQKWYPIRIPKNAMSEPEDNSQEPMTYDLLTHAEGIGMTGWNWAKRVSQWVAFDFDAIVGHSDKHAKKLDDAQLLQVRHTAEQIEWVTTRKSASGKGLHLYVFLNDFPTANHHEHAALARAVLGMMSALTGFDFVNKVDVCGGNMWVWHRKMTSDSDGFALLKQGNKLMDLPLDWKDHVKVVSGQKRKTVPGFLEERAFDLFDELAGQRPHVKLDEEHKRLIEWLRSNQSVWWWQTDHHMLVTHTYHLKEAHTELGLKGVFDTISTGADKGGDHNCFCYPLRRGAWSVRRYTPGCAESSSWSQDGSGWTQCFYNREPDLPTASRHLGGVEHTKGGFVFQEAAVALKAARALGANVEDVPVGVAHRQANLKYHKDGTRLVIEVNHEQQDDPAKMRGWLAEKGKWTRVLGVASVADRNETDVGNYDDIVRHLVTEGGDNADWSIKADTGWHQEPLTHVKSVLKALGTGAKEIDIVIGKSVYRSWALVNRPFEPEYPGDREWNRKAAQLRYQPADEPGPFPHWRKVLEHCGSGLDEALKQNAWAVSNSIRTGAEYLMLWIASLIQYPRDPLPYLFFYGPQNSGKSILHEGCMDLLISRGIVRAGNALKAKSEFNAELEDCVVAIVEEIDIAGADPKTVYNKIKDWVTAPKMSIHRKGYTPYDARNTTHWLQFANEHTACPAFPGDTRIVFIYVPKLDPIDLIPRKTLTDKLRQEAPNFLQHILGLEIPPSGDRLNVPVIETEQKRQASLQNLTLLQKFMSEKCFAVAGATIPFGEFFIQFEKVLEFADQTDRDYWTKQRVSRELPPEHPSGTPHGASCRHLANISWTPFKPGDILKKALILRGERLVDPS